MYLKIVNFIFICSTVVLFGLETQPNKIPVYTPMNVTVSPMNATVSPMDVNVSPMDVTVYPVNSANTAIIMYLLY